MARVTGKKLLSLHLQGVALTPGMSEFISNTLEAAATRSQMNIENINAGSPTLRTNAAGDLCVYVDSYSV